MQRNIPESSHRREIEQNSHLTFTSKLLLLATEKTHTGSEEASTAATMAPSFYLRHRRGREALDMASDRADKGAAGGTNFGKWRTRVSRTDR
jgi:hypothetical protein